MPSNSSRPYTWSRPGTWCSIRRWSWRSPRRSGAGSSSRPDYHLKAMPKVTLPGGEIREVASGSPVGELLPDGAICARVGERLVDRSWPVAEDVSVEPVLASEQDGLHVL